MTVHAEYWRDEVVAANMPTTSAGPVAAWAVSPELPAGLTLSTADGSIQGAPSKAAENAEYVVTAGNPAGSSSFTLSITVLGGECCGGGVCFHR